MDEEQDSVGIATRLGGALKRGATGMFNQARTAKVRLEITSLNGKKQDLFAEVGKKVYALYESGLVRNGQLLDLCSQVRRLDLDILDKEQYLSTIGPEVSGSGPMPPAPFEGGIDDDPQSGI